MKDKCGAVVTAEIRNAGGQWVSKSNTCGLSGTGTEVDRIHIGGATCYIVHYYFELVDGNQKQTQTFEDHSQVGSCGSSGACCDVVCDEYGYAAQGECIIGSPISGRWCTCVQAGSTCIGDTTKEIEYFEFEC